jgi:hypothetical protein
MLFGYQAAADVTNARLQLSIQSLAQLRCRIGAVFGTSNTFGIVRLYDHRGQPTVEIRFGQTADEPVTNFGKKCFSRRPPPRPPLLRLLPQMLTEF